uniref:NADH dehydrogenase subunit 4L n=1 Tax=Zaptyx adulta TaxID=1885882 RepID=A0A224AC87_9EUPU|nr:NADH dehydrogenase subunit 4L [Zaptyx adulta]
MFVNILNLSLLFICILFIYFYTVKSSFLSALMVLEAMVLLSLVFLAYFTLSMSEGINIFLIVLTLSVVEACLGLTLLITYVKVFGNDFILVYSNTFN